MNWVGGSRNRYMMRNDIKKQREFFEKKKMQQKMKNLGFPLPTCPKGTSTGSMDLVTLFIVNQIAAKKENRDPPKITHLSDSKGGPRSMRKGLLELPMSPCSPSRLSLVESQPHHSVFSVQGLRKRKHCFPEGFKCRQLSPVLESAFSDNSASDYQQHIADTHSPFSSSSVSSGQGLFPLRPNLQLKGQTQAPLQPHCSPPPWATPDPEQAKFIPFSQPGGMRECAPWSSGSNTIQYEPDTPTVARALFGSAEPDSTEARGPTRHGNGFSLNQSESKEQGTPMLGFTLDQSEAEEQFELELFSGFSSEEYGSEAGHFWKAESKIYLREETSSAPSQTPNAIDSRTRGPEPNSLTQLSNCTDVSSSCSGHTNGPLECCESSPSYSPRGVYLSSNSDEDGDECQECLLASSSYLSQGMKETPNSNQWTSQPELPQQHRPITPQINCPGTRGNRQRAMESTGYSDRASVVSDKQGDRQTESSNKAQFVSSHPPPEPQSSNIHQSKTASTETQDTGTQTTDIPALQTSDASTQCSLIPESTKNLLDFNFYSTPVDASIPNPATRGQAGHRDAAVMQITHSASTSSSSNSYRRGEEHWGRSSREYRAGRLSGNSIINKLPTHNTASRVAVQILTTPFLDAQHRTVDQGQERSKKDGRAVDKKVIQDFDENASLVKDYPEEEREKVTSASEVNRLSEETETLQEIADILLMLRQRKKEG